MVTVLGGKGCAKGRCSVSDEHGITLIELIVALLLLGIIFSAAASALINFSRASVQNERRVQATALMTDLHERMQALPWEDAVLYTEEIDRLADVGNLVMSSPPTWNGQELLTTTAGCVTLEAPDPLAVPDGIEDTDPAARTAVDACRVGNIPRVLEVIVVDGRPYRVYRVVTVGEQAGVPDGAAKRFTTVVEWRVLGRTLTSMLESERAAVGDELGTTDEASVAFGAFPNTVGLDSDGRNDIPFMFEAVFPSADVSLINTVRVSFTVLEVAADDTVFETTEELTLVQSATNPRRYRAEVPEGTFQFPVGTQLPELSWIRGSENLSTDSPLTFEAGGSGDPLTAEVTDVRVVGSNEYIVARIPPNNNRLCSTLTIQADVTGLGAEDQVRARYNASDGPKSVTLSPTANPATFEYSWNVGSSSDWIPPEGAGSTVTEEFTVVVVSGDGLAESGAKESPSLTFRRTTQSNGRCP